MPVTRCIDSRDQDALAPCLIDAGVNLMFLKTDFTSLLLIVYWNMIETRESLNSYKNVFLIISLVTDIEVDVALPEKFVVYLAN